jgi:hypothetical protein
MAVVLQEAVEQIRQRIDGGANRLAIQAEPGSGKTAVLDGLAAALDHGRRAVRITFPEGDDAALAALVDAATGIAPDLLERVVPGQNSAGLVWARRLDLVHEGLVKAGDRLVLLVDDPRFEATAEPDEAPFAERAVEVTTLLLHAYRGPIVLAGARIPVTAAEDAQVRLPLVPDPDLAKVDESVRLLGGRPSPAPIPPVVRQILAALAAAGVDVDRIPRHDRRIDRLVAHDLARIFLGNATLGRIMARLAAFRVPFSADVLDAAGLGTLSPREQEVVKALLSKVREEANAILVPEALAQTIRAGIAEGNPAWAPDDLPGDAYRFAAQVHRQRFEAASAHGDVPTAVREELEEIHQLTEAGDADALLARSLQFVEQYDALGKSLSRKALHAREREEELRRQAVRAYERAIEHDAQDAYAHHYIAYNLDILAIERERVEREYVAAKDLDRGHPWYHSRYVCFLITLVWIDDARAAWERALDDLIDTNGALRDEDYEYLHKQVARLLLERGRLDFAAEILEDVPARLRATSWWRALHQLRVCLEEDRDERLVFPPTLPIEERWKDGPHLVSDDEPAVRKWKPARVLGRDERAVLLDIAEDEETISTERLGAEELERDWNIAPGLLRAGSFVELVWYEDGTKAVKLWDRNSSSFDRVASLPKLFPNPQRYIRRAFA